MDTTAKVDIRKLQLLNDRIAQTIDALNQVRMSVHGLGLSHTTAGVPGVGLGAGAAFAPTAFGVSPFAAWNLQGLSHSTPFAFAQTPFAQAQFAQQVNPLLAAQLYGQQVFGGGLSHTSPVDAWGVVDPITATRIFQNFPYAQMPISPIW